MKRRHTMRCSLLLFGMWAVASSDFGLHGNTVRGENPQPAVIESDTESWKLFRGDSRSSGVAKSSLPEQLDELWKLTIEDGAFEATPAIVNETCYIADLDGTLYAVDLNTGNLRWKKKTGSLGFATSPAIANEHIYLGDIDGKFYCFDMKGEAKWEFEAWAEINSSANFFLRENVLHVLFGAQDATLYCLNAATGELAWKFEIEDQIRCCPTIVEDRAFVAGCDGRLHIIDLKAGKEVSSVNIDAPTGVTPAVMGPHVYFGTYAGVVFCVDWKNAKVVWTYEDSRHREIRSSPAVSQDILVIGGRSKKVWGIDPKTGKEIWAFTCRRGVDSSPVLVGDRVIVASTDGQLYAIDRKTGKAVWQKETGGSYTGSPAVAAGKLVIANDDGVIYCFGRAEE